MEQEVAAVVSVGRTQGVGRTGGRRRSGRPCRLQKVLELWAVLGIASWQLAAALLRTNVAQLLA